MITFNFRYLVVLGLFVLSLVTFLTEPSYTFPYFFELWIALKGAAVIFFFGAISLAGYWMKEGKMEWLKDLIL